ncbi:DUF4199 domain-containing protein [Lacinutrix sp. MedPE-SW]|uniref:DUF4199 domain-containing protein n=1 Tax=Lacinutrix sp. MedPE-SW TaxID=1860087 RepID=UPI00091D3AFF|nr:DUF4199 domain-containing protein [Lacinutrix sp. MedPE-SW]OIQ20245.1 MAG: DUF4199 domain-containing protein [Lacinutrix sp. MedPE-SW]
MKNLTLPIRFGIVISALLIAFFLVLSLFELHTHPAFSLGNGIIVGFGIYETIRYYKLEQGKQFSYTGGFTVGIVAGFLATIIFTIFFLLYATEVNPDFLASLLEVFKNDYNVSVGLVTFVVAIMGFATSVVLTLTCMQLFKQSRNIVEANKEMPLKKVS